MYLYTFMRFQKKHKLSKFFLQRVNVVIICILSDFHKKLLVLIGFAICLILDYKSYNSIIRQFGGSITQCHE